MREDREHARVYTALAIITIMSSDAHQGARIDTAPRQLSVRDRRGMGLV